ncbi:MAG: hypothetical protein BWZ08_02253 [candidate division BRC1 bacterium ADurb.BinA292]|nr:MAG: hypothetical protein BWZ08_02253 [candidate division BRC1 bacterium ADurb.BinA292]
MTVPPKHKPFGLRHGLWLALLAAGCVGFTVAQWSRGYVDFGDGNYMYIGMRIAEGVVPYRDILAPQPPCHLFMGALIYKLSQAFRPETPVYFFRGYSVALRLLTLLLVVALAMRAWGRPSTALVAGAIYLWFPIGFWWSFAFQSEPLEIVFLLAMAWCALRGTRAGDIGSGIFAALAALTNATAAPFLLVLIIFMLLHAPGRALRMAAPCLLLAGLVTLALHIWTEGAFLDVVVFKQVGTYPGGLGSPQFLNYARGKLLDQGGKVLALEGAFWVIALIAVPRYFRSSPLPPMARAGLTWFLLATMTAILYVTKGGTADYIFSLSEPAVAILAAGELVAWARRWKTRAAPEIGGGLSIRSIPFALPKLAAAWMLAVLALGPGLNFHALLWDQRAYELSERGTPDRPGVRLVRRIIQEHSRPRDFILAPPYYAVDSDRRLWGEFSELFIWNITYLNDLRAGLREGTGWRKMREIGEALRAQQIPIVILEMGQTGMSREVMLALQDRYVPLRPDRRRFLLHTLNTRLGFFIPAPPLEDETAAAERIRQWELFKLELLEVFGPGAANDQFGSWYAVRPAGPGASSGEAPPREPA